MDKSKAQGYANDAAALIRQSESLPGITAMAKMASEIIDKEFSSIDGIDVLSAAVVLSVIGVSDTLASIDAYGNGVPIGNLKSTAVMALAYIYAAHAIFTREGVLKTLDDHFSEGAKEGS